MPAVRLIAGLGNPGPQYQHTRHNVGAAFVVALAERYRIPLAEESRFKGFTGRGQVAGCEVRLLVPLTYVNLSGEAVGAMARFYRMEPEEILIAYDEMAFEPGVARIKSGGGDNGHNGIRSVIASLGNSRNFQRLRIGVGHPGDRNRVTAYLTSVRMPEAERHLMEQVYDLPESVLKHLLGGDLEKAMTDLHSRESPGPAAKGSD
jgi:peptidyl-tRNA hydrolase, PTH1 family